MLANKSNKMHPNNNQLTGDQGAHSMGCATPGESAQQTCTQMLPNYPASSPYVTGVGGTMLRVPSETSECVNVASAFGGKVL